VSAQVIRLPGSCGGSTSDPAGSVSAPENSTVTFATANLEQSFAFPANTKHFCVMNQSATSPIIKASWQSGESATNFFTIIPGAVYNAPPQYISGSLTIYWQSNKILTSPDGLKVVSWT